MVGSCSESGNQDSRERQGVHFTGRWCLRFGLAVYKCPWQHPWLTPEGCLLLPLGAPGSCPTTPTPRSPTCLLLAWAGCPGLRSPPLRSGVDTQEVRHAKMPLCLAFFFFFNNNNFIHLFMAMPGLHAAWALLWLRRAGAPFSL